VKLALARNVSQIHLMRVIYATRLRHLCHRFGISSSLARRRARIRELREFGTPMLCVRQTCSSCPTTLKVVVEDNRVNRLIADRLIRSLGDDVYLAEDGAEGLQAVRTPITIRHRSDGLSDATHWTGYVVKRFLFTVSSHVRSPNILQFDATRAIRSLPNTLRSGVLIIALSASTQQADVQMCLDAGMNDHIAKPIAAEELSVANRNWLTSISPSARVPHH